METSFCLFKGFLLQRTFYVIKLISENFWKPQLKSIQKEKQRYLIHSWSDRGYRCESDMPLKAQRAPITENVHLLTINLRPLKNVVFNVYLLSETAKPNFQPAIPFVLLRRRLEYFRCCEIIKVKQNIFIRSISEFR